MWLLTVCPHPIFQRILLLTCTVQCSPLLFPAWQGPPSATRSPPRGPSVLHVTCKQAGEHPPFPLPPQALQQCISSWAGSVPFASQMSPLTALCYHSAYGPFLPGGLLGPGVSPSSFFLSSVSQALLGKQQMFCKYLLNRGQTRKQR